MNLAADIYGDVPAGRGALEVQRAPSAKFETPPRRPTTSNNSPASRGNETGQLAPMMNGYGYGLPQRPRTGNSQHSQRSYTAEEVYAPFTPQKYPPRSLRRQYSEASRLHALSSGSSSSPANGRLTPDRGRLTPDRPPPVIENFSRPRKTSVDQSNARPPLLQTSTFPLAPQNNSRINASYGTQAPRERGFSTSSSQSNTIYNPAVQAPPSLRTSTSIPDYRSAAATYSRQRNNNNSHYQPDRGPSRLETYNPDNIYSSSRQERRTETLTDEEARTSFRSALTTNSSFVASGTERSSIMTKSSSVTSLFPQEEDVYEDVCEDDDDDGMSVDDAIGMYEEGFHDSSPEDNQVEDVENHMDDDLNKTSDEVPQRMISTSRSVGYRPETGDEGKRRSMRIAEAMNDSLDRPRSAGVRDSLAFFSGNLHQVTKQPSQRAQTGLLARHGKPIISFDGADDDDEDDDPLRELSITESLAITGRDPKILPPFGENRDRYGFKKSSVHVSREQYDAWNGPYTEYLIRRRKKWIGLMQESKLMTDKPMRFPPRSNKVKRFIRKGIPPDWRGAAWFYYAGGPAELSKNDGLYKQLLEMRGKGALNENDEELIERDLHRTFPDNIKFKPDPPASTDPSNQNGIRDSQKSMNNTETPLLQSLRRVLQAFSILNPKIGYCQSLNFLAGLLLLFMDEEKSFWMLNIITRHLPGTHEVNLEGANVDLGVLMSSIKESMPGIWAKINEDLDGGNPSNSNGNGKEGGKQQRSMRLPPITLCTTAWFMSCFIGTLPIETTLRVWDSFFYEGSKTLFRVALAIFKTGEAEIKAVGDPMEIFQVVQAIPRRLVDANALCGVVWERWSGFRHLSQEEIERRRRERREGYAEERRVAAGGEISREGSRRGMFGRRKRTGLVL